MSRPTQRNQKHKINQAIKQQSWLVFLLVIIGIAIDFLLIHSVLFSWAKSFASGVILGFLGQFIVAKLTFRHTGYRARHSIVNSLFLAEGMRWIITILGFMLIFIYLKPLHAFATIFAFVLIQLAYMIILWRLR